MLGDFFFLFIIGWVDEGEGKGGGKGILIAFIFGSV